MQGIYNYIPETNHVSRVYSVAAVPLHVMLFRPGNMLCTFTLALAVVYVCSVKYGCCLQFLNFVLAWYVARVLS
jgi:hypothetical protein